MAKKKSFFKRIGSYFIEIIIIIIGISLSFALNDWEQKKSARTDYQNYLKRLQEDIRVDSIQMRSDIQSYQSKINGIEVIFKFHNTSFCEVYSTNLSRKNTSIKSNIAVS